MIAFNPEYNQDPYLDSIARRSEARVGMTPDEIAAAVSPQDPQNVIILPYREEGYGLSDLASYGSASIVLLPAQDRGQQLTVIDGGKLGFLAQETARINGNLPAGERVTPDIRIRGVDTSESYALPYAVGTDGTVQGGGDRIVIHQGALLESNMTVAVNLAHHTARLSDYRNLDAGDRAVLDGVQAHLTGRETDATRQAVQRQHTEDTLQADHRMAQLTRHDPRLHAHFNQLLQDERLHQARSSQGLALPGEIEHHAALHHPTGLYGEGAIDAVEMPIDNEFRAEFSARSNELAQQAQERFQQDQARWEQENARAEQQRAAYEAQQGPLRPAPPHLRPSGEVRLSIGAAELSGEQDFGGVYGAEGIYTHPLKNDNYAAVGRAEANVYTDSNPRAFDASADASLRLSTPTSWQSERIGASVGLGVAATGFRDTRNPELTRGAEEATLLGAYARGGIVAEIGKALIEADVKVPVLGDASREFGGSVNLRDLVGNAGISAEYRDVSAPDAPDYGGTKTISVGVNIGIGKR